MDDVLRIGMFLLKWFSNVLRLILILATELRHLGVVAVDVAGSAHGADEQYEKEVVLMFQVRYLHIFS